MNMRGVARIWRAGVCCIPFGVDLRLLRSICALFTGCFWRKSGCKSAVIRVKIAVIFCEFTDKNAQVGGAERASARRFVDIYEFAIIPHTSSIVGNSWFSRMTSMTFTSMLMGVPLLR